MHTLGQGTEKYAAPEVFFNNKYDEKCDIYSLGLIAMDLFCIDKQRALTQDTKEQKQYIKR